MKRHKFKRQLMRFKQRVVPRSETVLVRHKPRMMLARNEYYSGHALYRYELGEWICSTASECLGFLCKQTASAAKLELLRRGFSWEWK
jgi:hypothetical protein